MKIVEFNNGQFALRKFRWFSFMPRYVYLDIKTLGYWWSRYDIYFSHCLGSLGEIKKADTRLKRVVKV